MLFGQATPKYWARWDRAFTSELMGTEVRRTIDRLRLDGALDDAGVVTAHEKLATVERSLDRVELGREVLYRAGGPMPTVAKLVDAVHVVSALVVRERFDDRVQFATQDRRQQRIAIASGLPVAPA